MSLNSGNSPAPVVVPIGAITVTTTVKALKLARAMKLKALHMIDPTGLAAHDTNYVTIGVKQGSNVIASWSTKLTDGDGALSANAWASKANLDAIMAAGDVDVVITVFGTGALTAGSKICLELFG